MSKVVNSVRWSIVVPLFLLGIVLISLAIIISSATIVVTDRDNVKGWLDGSGFYENIVDFGVSSLLNEINKTNGGSQESLEESEFLPDEIKNKNKISEEAEKIFAPEWIEEETEEVIDSVYDYLEKENNEINFEINFSEPNENGQEALAELFKKQIAKIPDCTDNKTVLLDDFDLYNEKCVPKNLNRSSLNETIDESVNEIMLFENMTISSDTLNISEENLEPARTTFTILEYTPYALLGAILIISILIFFLTPKSKNKYHLLGIMMIIPGTISFVLGVTAKISFSNLFSMLEELIKESPPEMINLIKPVLREAYHSLLNTNLIISSVVIIIGAVLLFMGNKKHKNTEAIFKNKRKLFMKRGKNGKVKKTKKGF